MIIVITVNHVFMSEDGSIFMYVLTKENQCL